MKIGIGNDHHGVELKNRIIEYLKETNIEFINFGTDTDEIVDFVDYAIKVSEAVKNKTIDKGILICASGIGMCVTANKVKGIICAPVRTPEEAHTTREHNDANVIALNKSVENYKEIIDEFLNTDFSSVERYNRRKQKIMELENKY